MMGLSLVAVPFLSAVLACPVAPAQTASSPMAPMKHDAAVRSTTLTITGLDGTAKTFTLGEMMSMPQTTVTVTNAHSHQQETYGGVAIKDLLALAGPAKVVPVNSGKPKLSPRMTVIIARGTDNFRVAITLCDTDPGCRSGQAIVADTMDGQPLGTDGAFKLILTEDKIPGRWVRNLESLTVKNLGSM